MSVFTTNPLTDGISQVEKKCKLSKGFLPNINPIIHSLSTYTSNLNDYTVIYITGENFFPFGSSYVIFGQFKNISITYYSSFNISFSIPLSVFQTNNKLKLTMFKLLQPIIVQIYFQLFYILIKYRIQ